MDLANQVLVELQLKQQEIIEILRKKIQNLEKEHSKLAYASGEDNKRIKELEKQIKELKAQIIPPDFIN
tara:strand:- start:9459 stop:9665 length:207 start_codon:yes stop_codon:yes gene_type:complete